MLRQTVLSLLKTRRPNPAAEAETLSTADRVPDSGKQSTKPAVEAGDSLALWLFAFLVFPSFPFLTEITHRVLDRSYTKPVIGTLITFLGYYSVWKAIRIYSGGRWHLIIASIVVPYAIIDAIFTVNELIHPANQPHLVADFWRSPPATAMTPTFLILFAAFKILFTSVVSHK